MKSIYLTIIVAFTICTIAAQKPNIVFIIADDCTFSDIGCYGGQAYTPNIDAIAKEGMLFTRCFQAAPMCSPTRHNIFTGLYPIKSGAYPNHTSVTPNTKSIVQYLNSEGYRVAQSGKTHVGPSSVFNWEKIAGAKNPEFDKIDIFLSDVTTKKEPFCLLLCSNEPHTPWNKGDPSRYPKEKIKLPSYFVDTPETRDGMSRYLAEVTYFDGQVGQTVALLKKYNLEKNTLLVVVSEQGNALPFAKWTCYDKGLQSAFIARWPGTIKPGSTNPALIEYTDILPTFIEVAGGKLAPELDGKSLLPLFKGKTTHKEYVFGEMTTRGVNNGSDYFGIRSVRSKNYKYIWNFTPEITFNNACTNAIEFKSWITLANSGDKKAIDLVHRYQHRPEVELYDIIKDPLEQHNLAGKPELSKTEAKLKLTLLDWMNHCGDKGQETELKAYEHMRNGEKRALRFKKNQH